MGLRWTNKQVESVLAERDDEIERLRAREAEHANIVSGLLDERAALVEAVKEVGTAYRLDAIRLREIGRTTEQADYTLARLDTLISEGNEHGR